MKVKCRGYEGELIDLSAIKEGKDLQRKTKVYEYVIRIAIDNGLVTIEPAYSHEIEFIKE